MAMRRKDVFEVEHVVAHLGKPQKPKELKLKFRWVGFSEEHWPNRHNVAVGRYCAKLAREEKDKHWQKLSNDVPNHENA